MNGFGKMSKAAVLALLATARGAELALRALPDALARGLVCNDGTAAAYYVAEGLNPDRVLIYQQGGGWCWDAASCAARAPALTGNATWAPTLALGGVFDSALFANRTKARRGARANVPRANVPARSSSSLPFLPENAL